MANGNIPSWEEWNEQLSDEQRSYSLYKILESMDKKLSACPERFRICDERFGKIERRKKLDTGVSGFFGLIGGASVMLIKKMLGG